LAPIRKRTRARRRLYLAGAGGHLRRDAKETRAMPDITRQESSIAAGARIGHVHLKVADLGRMLDFYVGVLGFALTQRYGRDAAFVSAGGYHHHIGFNSWESAGGAAPPPGTTGLYHLAILYPVPRRSCRRRAPPARRRVAHRRRVGSRRQRGGLSARP
jgi:catechol-2,3-dioxygenase